MEDNPASFALCISILQVIIVINLNSIKKDSKDLVNHDERHICELCGLSINKVLQS